MAACVAQVEDSGKRLDSLATMINFRRVGDETPSGPIVGFDASMVRLGRSPHSSSIQRLSPPGAGARVGRRRTATVAMAVALSAVASALGGATSVAAGSAVGLGRMAPASEAHPASCTPVIVRHSEVVSYGAHGQTRWTVRLPVGDGIPDGAAAPVVRAGVVFAAQGGVLLAVRESTGATLWTAAAPGVVFYLQSVSAGIVYAAFDREDRPRVVLVDPSTGRTRWTRRLPGQGLDTPVPTGNGGLSVAVTTGAAEVIDLRTGRLRWRRAGNRNTWTATAGGGVVVRTAGSVITVYDDRTGTLRWQRRVPVGVPSVSIAQGLLVVQATLVQPGPTGLAAYDLRDGGLRWTIPSTGEANMLQVLGIGDGTLVAARITTGHLVVVDLGTGKIRFHGAARVLTAAPVLVTRSVVGVAEVRQGQRYGVFFDTYRALTGRPTAGVRLHSGILYDPRQIGSGPVSLFYFGTYPGGTIQTLDPIGGRLLWQRRLVDRVVDHTVVDATTVLAQLLVPPRTCAL